ncbi:MAG TPA: hypothetical protein P5123_07320, partial [Spirochaetota bacterium]|nr:hypothetical protein [Spirochaetota bacterium]
SGLVQQKIRAATSGPLYVYIVATFIGKLCSVFTVCVKRIANVSLLNQESCRLNQEATMRYSKEFKRSTVGRLHVGTIYDNFF